jgi:hypothetical protein
MVHKIVYYDLLNVDYYVEPEGGIRTVISTFLEERGKGIPAFTEALVDERLLCPNFLINHALFRHISGVYTKTVGVVPQ